MEREVLKQQYYTHTIFLKAENREVDKEEVWISPSSEVWWISLYWDRKKCENAFKSC